MESVLGAVFSTIITISLNSLLTSFGYNFTLQGILNNNILAIIGIIAIIGLTVIGVLLIIRLRNYLSNITSATIIQDKTPDQKLDDLLPEMESFVNKWRYSSVFRTCYRRQIEINTLGGDKKSIKKIIQYSSNIYTKINLVKKVGVTTINNKLDEMMPSVNNLVGLGEDMREFYWSSKKSKTIDPEDKKKFLANGDHICRQFDGAVYALLLLRKDLP